MPKTRRSPNSISKHDKNQCFGTVRKHRRGLAFLHAKTKQNMKINVGKFGGLSVIMPKTQKKRYVTKYCNQMAKKNNMIAITLKQMRYCKKHLL